MIGDRPPKDTTTVMLVTCDVCAANFRGPRGDAMADFISQHFHGRQEFRGHMVQATRAGYGPTIVYEWEV